MSESSATIPGVETEGPTIQESYDKLLADGLITEEGAPGTAPTEVPTPKTEADAFAKFRNADGEIDTEKLQKSYLALETKQSTGAEDEPDDVTEDDVEAAEGDDEPLTSPEEYSTVSEIVTEAGLDLQDLSAKYWAEGSLSDADYAALDGIGYPKDMVDTYMAGKGSAASGVVSSALETAGGGAEYNTMTDWLVANASEEELDAFEEAVTSGSKAKTLQAVRSLQQQYTAAHPADETVEPSEIIALGNNGGDPTAGGYPSQQAYLDDMADPRYLTHSTFRAKVMEKLARSKGL